MANEHICTTCIYGQIDCPKWKDLKGVVFDAPFPGSNVVACDEYKKVKRDNGR